MIVIYRNGHRTFVSGWREWLILALAGVFAALVVTAVIGLIFGVALTVGLVLLIVVPLAFVLAVMGQALMPKQ